MNPDPFEDALDLQVRSCASLIVVETCEEERLVRKVKTVCERLQRQGWTFDLGKGFKPLWGTNGAPPAVKDQISALDHIDQSKADALYVQTDAQDWLDKPPAKSKLRSVACRLKSTRKCILIPCSSFSKLPVELNHLGASLNLPFPTTVELGHLLDFVVRSANARDTLSPPDRDQLLRAAVGLNETEARILFANAIVKAGVLDPRAIEFVSQEKTRIIAQSCALEICSTPERAADVGGLGALKEWVRQRGSAFTQAGQAYGLPSPRGLLLLGIPGTGKSLAAKMIATTWRLPLVRLNVGAIFNSLVGESEKHLRDALSRAEAMAPIVLWIEEIEKSFPAHGDLDGGTSQRVLGSFLTWTSENTAPVFVVATANDISALPPELSRKGRFDETLFLNLPTLAERREIFQVHLEKHRRKSHEFDLERLARASEGYVGAEIQAAVIDAMHIAFDDRPRPFTTEDILAALHALVPQARSQREAIEGPPVAERRPCPASLLQ